MTRKLIFLGLSVASVLVIGAAAVADTAGPYFKVVESPVEFTGEQIAGEHFINTSAGKTECGKSQWGGGLGTKTGPNATLKVLYENCTLNSEAATVETGTCTYELTMVENSSPPTSTFGINCESGKEITIKTAACTIHIHGTQPNLAEVEFQNTEKAKPAEDVDMTFAVKGIKYVATPGCPGSHLTQSNGEYKESVTIKAETVDKEPMIFWVE